jgi:RNA polymerase sigma-70 factor (ECF subfamily)
MSSEPSRDEPADRELLRRAAGGDLDAFSAIYRRHQQVVYRFGRAMTGSPDAAEDITQEVFTALYGSLARYDPDRASFTTYLYGIVRNLSRERLRRDRRFLSLGAIGPRNHRSAQLAHPIDMLEEAELAGQVREAMRKLPARYRELVILCDLHGLSYADAAIVVRISTAAVRSRLHRGRQLLRRRLAPLAQSERRRAVNPARCAI